MIEVFKPGTQVKVLMGDEVWVRGYIQAVRLQLNDTIDYNVIYWKDDERKTAWVASFEVAPLDAADKEGRTGIGFIDHTLEVWNKASKPPKKGRSA